MKINKAQIDIICEKTIEYSLYCLVFFLPASKSMIEVCATIATFAWLVKKINNFGQFKAGLSESVFLRITIIANLLLLFPLVMVISSTLSTRHMDLSITTPLPFHIALISGLVAAAILTIIIISLRYTQHIGHNLKIPILLFLDVTIITSMFTSQHINISLGAFFFKTLEYLLIFFIMAEIINTQRRLTNILIALSISSFMIGLDGLYQLVTKFDFLRGYPLYAGKMTASFQFSNNLGCYLATVLPVPISFIIQGTTNKKVKACLIALSILLLVCLLFTRVRGAWLGFAVGLFFVCLFSGKKALFTAIVFLLILVLFSPTVIKDQFKSFVTLYSDTSTEDRIVIWETGWRMFRDRPFWGHGLGTFMSVFSRYKPQNYSWVVYAHNCYLQIIAEMGIVGLLIFLWFTFVLIKGAVLKLIKCEDKFLKAFLTGLIGGILAYLVHSFFDTNLYSLPLAVLFWAFAGLAAAKIQFE